MQLPNWINFQNGISCWDMELLYCSAGDIKKIEQGHEKGSKNITWERKAFAIWWMGESYQESR